MGWIDYYTLLVKYKGTIERATKDELQFARWANPNNPEEALDLARSKYRVEMAHRGLTLDKK